MTVVLRSIKQEQSAFRQDVEKTKKELQATWDKKRTAKLEATAASKTMDSLKKKMGPLRKKLVVATAVKDLATAKVKALGNQVKAVGKMVSTPVVKVVTKGAQALSAIGKGFAQVAKTAAIGVGAVSAAAAAGLTALFSGSTELAKAQIEAETKLEAVLGNVASIQARGAGAAAQAKEKLMGVASELQQIGVIGDEVTLAGMQQPGHLPVIRKGNCHSGRRHDRSVGPAKGPERQPGGCCGHRQYDRQGHAGPDQRLVQSGHHIH